MRVSCSRTENFKSLSILNHFETELRHLPVERELVHSIVVRVSSSAQITD